MVRMPKMYSIAVLAVALLLAISPVTRADNVQGTLLAIEPDDHVFTLNTDDGRTLSFRVELTASVRIGGLERTVWDMQPGMQISVDFRQENGALIAQSISVDQP